MSIATQAAEILERHRSGWRFYIGWPYGHEPQPLEPKHGGAVSANTGAALRLTTPEWLEKQKLRRAPHRKAPKDGLDMDAIHRRRGA